MQAVFVLLEANYGFKCMHGFRGERCTGGGGMGIVMRCSTVVLGMIFVYSGCDIRD